MAIDVSKLVVPAASVTRPKRGRKAVVIPMLNEALALVTKTNSIRLGPIFAEVKGFGKLVEDDKQRVATVIRNHWKATRKEGDKLSIAWVVEGENIAPTACLAGK